MSMLLQEPPPPNAFFFFINVSFFFQNCVSDRQICYRKSSLRNFKVKTQPLTKNTYIWNEAWEAFFPCSFAIFKNIYCLFLPPILTVSCILGLKPPAPVPTLRVFAKNSAKKLSDTRRVRTYCSEGALSRDFSTSWIMSDPAGVKTEAKRHTISLRCQEWFPFSCV